MTEMLFYHLQGQKLEGVLPGAVGEIARARLDA